MMQRIRKFNGKEYTYYGTFKHPDFADNAKDKLKYSAFTSNRLVAFRVIKRRPMEYELYYRYHADVKTRRKK
jgi:hypothetical protein